MNGSGIFLIMSLAILAVNAGEPPLNQDPPPPVAFDTYWMVFLNKGPDRDQTKEEAVRIQSGHIAHMSKQKKEGLLLIAGPLETSKDHPMSGIVLYSADLSLEKVQEITAADPAVKAGRLTVEIIKWWTPKGALSFPEQ